MALARLAPWVGERWEEVGRKSVAAASQDQAESSLGKAKIEQQGLKEQARGYREPVALTIGGKLQQTAWWRRRVVGWMPAGSGGMDEGRDVDGEKMISGLWSAAG